MSNKNFLYFSFIFLWILLCCFSFTQKDPNLTIYNYPIIKDVIFAINQFGQNQKQTSAIIFSFLSLSLFINYLYLINFSDLFSSKNIKYFLLALLFIGVFAYPFLSHDIFNYLFNARMVLKYGKDPHIYTALDFPNDLWTRFMHNTHTSAPYGRLFTVLSLIPSFLGFGNFTLTFLFHKIFNSVFFLACAYLIFLIAKKNQNNPIQTAICFLFNPLFLIETFINGHNDSIMLFFALLSVYLFLNRSKKIKYKIIAAISYLASIFIKYVTIVLAPIYILSRKFKLDFFLYSGFILLILIFTRIGQTHAWYLMWSFPFLILSKSAIAKKLAIFLTLGGLIRYIPFIYKPEYFPSQNYLLLLTPLALLLLPKTRNLIK